jgi:hypothetical protein
VNFGTGHTTLRVHVSEPTQPGRVQKILIDGAQIGVFENYAVCGGMNKAGVVDIPLPAGISGIHTLTFDPTGAPHPYAYVSGIELI